MGHSHTREPVAVPQVESIDRIHEFFKGNQMMDPVDFPRIRKKC